MKDTGNRPDIRPEWSIAEKILQIVCPLFILAGFVLLTAEWGKLPSRVPVHFGFFGAADTYGVKNQLLFLPIVSTGIYFMITVFERFPKLYNFPFEITGKNAPYVYQLARELFVCIKTALSAVLTYTLYCQIQTAKGKIQGLGSWFVVVLIAVLFFISVFYLIRFRKYVDPTTNS
jgi:hypothetical protein